MSFRACLQMLKRAPFVATIVLLSSLLVHAQIPIPDGHLDPTRGLQAAPEPSHTPLPEQYLWTSGDITAQLPNHNKFPWNRPDLRVDPHFFRTTFTLLSAPPAATLYIAGPRSAKIWLNGQLAASFASDIDAPIAFHVFHADVASFLRSGVNTLAIEAVRGRGIVAGAGPVATQQITYGEVLAAKILPATFGVEAPAVVISTPSWKSTATLTENWQQPNFDDSHWPAVATLGPIESDPDLMQWNGDAGMYEWPGYMGMSPNLRSVALVPQSVSHVFNGAATLTHVDAITFGTSEQPFTITNLAPATDLESPALLLDFGREIAGRLLVQSSSPCESTISVAYGESEIEALATGLTPTQQGGNYLGTNLLHIPQGGTARGPKSAFRYVRIRFLRGCKTLTFPSIRAEAIYYPVEYKGSFDSSDPVLNRIWETGAYTAHLCMQDGIWDAPKRDRGRWIGDIDIAGRVISTVFADTALLEDTLNRLAEATHIGQHVNGIPSYSALWITSLASLYAHSGDRTFLEAQHQHLLRILASIDSSLDSGGRFTNPGHQWLFVDWSPSLYAFTPQAEAGTQLQFLRAYKEAIPLLQTLNDNDNAARYAAQYEKVETAAKSNDLGSSWQLNALAILTLRQPPSGRQSLAQIKQDSPSDPIISPYFNAYLLDALSALDRRRDALDWMRQYWGGMLAEGATSFWESYDLRWPKTNPHLSLQADGTSGFFVSMAHGWSSGPTAWLSENVLGIRDARDGYRTVTIAPNLLGLDWAKGSVPTPHGLIKIALDKSKGLTLDLPAGVAATLYYNSRVTPLDKPGHYIFPAN
jgi:alpha-L-rhamnosidase